MYYIEDPLDCTLWYSRKDIWGRQRYSAGGRGFLREGVHHIFEDPNSISSNERRFIFPYLADHK